ncbi:hypothetical protein C5Y96_00330 [Blastopirellula marina]|uniref:HEAT repeat domain-containing protein n=1 Tax=Blastopirellula marina TaxID=124 RepID=A0A2S8GCP6_9BACT|nr:MULTISPECIES: hypothetical protein [Pirellulaceae]PQO41854.1 hypothetical protein C5Y96_00330 [Blastopirellula marina]RCS56406.1 hypothetical protein DTL36_00330 [Bremerella cremea]
MKRVAVSTLVLAIMACCAQTSWAQYNEIPVTATDIDPDSRDTQTRIRFGQAQAAVREYLSGKTMDEQGRTLIRKFFRDAYLKSWTSKANWTQAGAKRQEFLRAYYGPLYSDQAARAMVNEIMVEFMREYIKPNYHPVLRYNAILLVGDLRSKEMDNINQTPEVPYAPATAILLSALEDPNQSDAVKVGAWIGLMEQCQLYGVNLGAMAGPEKTKVMDLVVKTLSEKAPPEGRGADAHTWMRKRAIDVARSIGNAGRDGALANALNIIILDESLPIEMRCNAIAAIGHLNYDAQTAAKLDVAKESAEIGKVALEAVSADVAWYDNTMTEYFKALMAPGGTGGMMGGEYGPGGGGMIGPMARPTSPRPSRPSRSTRNRGTSGPPSEYGEFGGPGEEMMEPEIIRDPIMVRMETLFRRRVKTHLDDCKQALVGQTTQIQGDGSSIREGLIRYAKNAEDRALIVDLSKSMLSMLATVDDDELWEDDLLKNSKTRLDALTIAAQKLASKAAVEIASPDAAAPADVPGGAAPADIPGGPAGPPADVPGGAPADVPGAAAPADVPGAAPADVPGAAPADVPGAAPAPMEDVPGGPAADVPS